MRNCFKWVFILLCLVSSSCSGFLDGAHPRTSKDPLEYSKVPLRNEAVVKYVNSVGQKLFQNIDSSPPSIPKMNIVVLETSRIQGASFSYSPRIEVTRGMLNVIRNEAELAALLGHEIGHKVLHSGKRAPTTDNEVTKAKWNQQREREADEFGALLAGRAGYDPYALVDFFDHLSRFQKRNVFTMLDEWTATHRDFVNRSKDLRKALEKKGAKQGGPFSAKEYRTALEPLRSVHTLDAVNEIFPNGPNGILPRLAEIEAEVQSYEQSRKPMPPVRFVEVMDELSDIVKRCGMDPHALLVRFPSKAMANKPSFMKEVMSQDSPVWADEELQKTIEGVLETISRIGVGFIPVVGDAVDLYEFFTGEEFGTGHRLTFGERVITAAGLLAGSGAAWRKIAGEIGETLQDAKLVNQLGRRTITDANHVLKNADELVEAGLDNRVVVIGRRWDTAVAKDWPGHTILDLPKEEWSLEKNYVWVQDAIRRRAKIYLASPQMQDNLVNFRTGEPTVYARELEWLGKANYHQAGDYLLPSD